MSSQSPIESLKDIPDRAGSDITLTAPPGTGSLPATVTDVEKLKEAVDALVLGTPLPTPYNSATGQTGSLWNSNATVDPANGIVQDVPIGADATTGITLAFTTPVDTTKSFTLKIRVIRPAGNQRIITLTGGNITSSGGLMSSGYVLLSDGASTVAAFEYEWVPRISKYDLVSARYDTEKA